MDEEEKKTIMQELNIKIGGDINDLSQAYKLENDLIQKREQLQNSLHVASNLVPTKLSSAIKKAENNSTQIQNLKNKSETLKIKVNDFLKRTEPLRTELDKRFLAINKLEQVFVYLKSFEKVEDLSRQMKQCNDDEQLVLLYGDLKDMCLDYKTGHRAIYVREYTHYWHNVLKDKLTKHYEDVLKQLKWPIGTAAEHSPPPKDVLIRFYNLTRYLFLIEEPEDLENNSVSEDIIRELYPCLPVKILLKPLKKRFIFHFTGSRQTARIDRPEWFLTQTLTWIKDHQAFVRNYVQPVADKLEMANVQAVDEFNAGLISLAAERLHTVLGLYHTQGSEMVDVDAAFAHAVDETLGFHRELTTVTENDVHSIILSVLTKAETFVRWLAVEKKYAVIKMDEMLSNEQWCEAVASGVGSAVGSMLWVPRGAEWFIALLKTIEDRYAVLPQPGHRLQFLELQLELIEEWRIRLTQLLTASVASLTSDSLVTARTPHPLIAQINTAHYCRMVLLQWAHSLHYLQLHFYRKQFEHFTQQQHHDDTDTSSSSSDDDSDTENNTKKSSKEGETDDTMSLKEVEVRARALAMNEVTRRNSLIMELSQFDIASPIANLAVTDPLVDDEVEEAGVFSEAPALLAHLRDAGLSALAEHILMEFKAALREYKKQKWHAWLMVEESALSVSVSLCRALAALCTRLSGAQRYLAAPLTARLRAHLAADVDQYVFEEVVLENWFNTGGTVQFTHDVKRNLMPAFAAPNKVASQANQLPKLLEACKLLNMDYDDARRLRSAILKTPNLATENLNAHGLRNILPNECTKILNQRTDLSENTSPASVMELF